jgi:hypothetical protein
MRWAVLVCDQCRKTAYIPKSSTRSTEQMRALARTEGWVCEIRDLCPTCVMGRKVEAYVDAYIAGKEAQP